MVGRGPGRGAGTGAGQHALGVDVGGTSVRLGIVTIDGEILPGSVAVFDPESAGEADAIIRRFVEHLRPAVRLGVRGIGIGFPGPFDYEQGISRLQGLQKYDTLYGMNIREALRERLRLRPEFPIRFVNDADAFALGEARFGSARAFGRALVVTIGTGCGSSFLEGGRIVTEGRGVPQNGWVYGLPFREGTIDDALSRRGILRLWQEEEPGSPLDVKDVALLAQGGEPRARRVFQRFGNAAALALGPIAKEFQAQSVVFGGQISKSFALFEEAFVDGLAAAGATRVVAVPAGDIDNAALKGAASLIP